MHITDEYGRLVLEKGGVQLKPYKPRTPKQVELLSDEELRAGAGGYLVFDTECYPNYFLVAFKCLRTGKYLYFECGRTDRGRFFSLDQQKLSWVLHSYTCIGFNSLKYDLLLIWLCYVNQDPEIIKALSNKIVSENLWRQNAEHEFNFKCFPTPHIDLIEVCPLRGSLKLYMARLHAKRIQELPIDHMKELTKEEMYYTLHYCFNDLDGTELLFNNLLEQLKLRADLSAEYRQDLMSKSDAQIAEAVIGSELMKLKGRWPSKPKFDVATTFFYFEAPKNLFFQTEYMQTWLRKIQSWRLSLDFNGRLEAPHEFNETRIKIGNSVYRLGIGGLHSSENEKSVVSNDDYTLYDRDVASYYPRIVLNCGLFPEHLGIDFLTVYNSIVDRRLAAKKAKRLAESENLKVTINGTFGKTGSPYSILYAPKMTIQITVGGQLYLLMLIEYLELNGIEVVSANTDGIVIYCHKDKRELMLSIIKQWEQITGFETEETKYDAIYSRDVNAYMAIKRDKEGKIEFKGKNVYYDPWRGKSAKDLYWRFQKNPTAQICVEAIEGLIGHQKPIEDTIRQCTDLTKFVLVKNVNGGAHKDREYLGRVIRWYYAKGITGTINYVKSNNKVPDSDGGKPVMDLPDEFPNDVDYSQYEAKTKEMLYDMGYLKRPEQLRFF